MFIFYVFDLMLIRFSFSSAILERIFLHFFDSVEMRKNEVNHIVMHNASVQLPLFASLLSNHKDLRGNRKNKSNKSFEICL